MCVFFLKPPLLDNQQLYDEFQAKWDDTGFTSLLDSRKSLPVYTHKKALLDLIKENQVVIVRGETGCGKTTQVTVILLGWIWPLNSHFFEPYSINKF